MTTITSEAVPNEQRTEHPHIALMRGAPVVRGARLPVRLIAQRCRAGDSVDGVLRTYPHLSAAAVYDAVSYYLDHTEELEHEITANRIENVLAQTGARMDERGFITFPPSQTNGRGRRIVHRAVHRRGCDGRTCARDS
ncbi:MAG: DUF433 domain-containing protein [Chloroflexi bacterium]|nr:DUF433 domain-containing protein [Chloroflexota bacterium]